MHTYQQNEKPTFTCCFLPLYIYPEHIMRHAPLGMLFRVILFTYSICLLVNYTELLLFVQKY